MIDAALGWWVAALLLCLNSAGLLWLKWKGRGGAQAPRDDIPLSLGKFQVAMQGLNESFRRADPSGWPTNFLAALAHLHLTYLAGWPNADEIINIYGAALHQAYAQLARQAAAQPEMPSRSIN